MDQYDNECNLCHPYELSGNKDLELYGIISKHIYIYIYIFIYIYLLDRLWRVNAHKFSLSRKYHIYFKKLHRHLSIRVKIICNQLQRRLVSWVNNTYFIAYKNHFYIVVMGNEKDLTHKIIADFI